MRSVLVVLVGFTGCTHRHHITEAHELSGERVVISGPRGRVNAVGFDTPNGVEFQDRQSGRVLPAADIDTIERTSHGRGALDGLAWGGLAGGLAGAVAGLADGDDDCGDDELCILEFSATDKAVIGAVVVGGLGGLVGLVVGGVIGATDIYAYPGAQVIVKPVGPPGSVAGVSVSF